MEGDQWVVVHAVSPSIVYYFDSLGDPPNCCINKSLLDQFGNGAVFRNLFAYQSPDLSLCAYYCLYFILMVNVGYSLSEIHSKLTAAVNRDEYVKNLVDRVYD